jgi:hypothetical protein
MVTSFKALILLFLLAISTKYIKCEESFLRTLYEPSTDPIYDYLFMVRNIQCSAFTNCPAPNACIDANTCKCADGYVNYLQGGSITYCLYKQKSQLTAFLLQFFVFHGAGQFYVGNNEYAIPQLIICLCPTIISILMCIMGLRISKGESQEPRTIFNIVLLIFNCLFCCIFSAWWLADVIIFGMNKYNDSNGIPLRSW